MFMQQFNSGDCLSHRQYREAWVSWLSEMEFNWFATITFNPSSQMSLKSGYKRLSKLIGHVDRAIVGKKYLRQPNKRLFGVAVAENVSSNFHYHMPFRMGKDVSLPAVEKAFINSWSKIAPAGEIDMRPASAGERKLQEYITKQVPGDYNYIDRDNLWRELWEDYRIVLSVEFHK